MNYQKIEGISTRYERDCQERWELIKPHLPAEGVLVDIGAAEGAFLKLAADETNLLAVGLEKHIGRARYQINWLSPEYYGKIISCNCNFGQSLSSAIAETPDFFDVVLLLSVFHWINNDRVLKDLASMTGKLFIEIPDLNDHKSTGQKFMERVRKVGSEKLYFEQVTGREVTLLGVVKAHTYPTRNLWMIDGDFMRQAKRPHIDFSGKSRNSYRQHFTNGKLIFLKNRKEQIWIPGINLSTLQTLGIVWPPKKWWYENINQSIKGLDKNKIKGDIRIHNIIVSREQIHWIDLNHRGTDSTISRDIESLTKEIL